MFFSKYLLISERFDEHISVLEGVRQKRLPKGSFVICINKATKNLMDIYYEGELHKPHINMDNMTIIAICKNKKDAKEKCAEILGDFVAKNKSLDKFKEKF